jgi:hypothetical protein
MFKLEHQILLRGGSRRCTVLPALHGAPDVRSGPVAALRDRGCPKSDVELEPRSSRAERAGGHALLCQCCDGIWVRAQGPRPTHLGAEPREELLMNAAEAAVGEQCHDVAGCDSWREVVEDGVDALERVRGFAVGAEIAR